MKKIIMLLALCMMCLFSFVVNAEENKAANPMNWEISMMPKPKEEEIEAARWSIVLENKHIIQRANNIIIFFIRLPPLLSILKQILLNWVWPKLLPKQWEQLIIAFAVYRRSIF